MLEPDLIELFVRPLNQAGIRYLVCGSVAAMLYGEPRVTHTISGLKADLYTAGRGEMHAWAFRRAQQ